MTRRCIVPSVEDPAQRPSRVSKKQKVVMVALFYLQTDAPGQAVWTTDLARWLHDSDPNWRIPLPSLHTILKRCEDLGLVVGLWEQGVTTRPSRKYYQLDPHDGRAFAVQALQELRADRRRPIWVPIPELNGRSTPEEVEGFIFTPPDGALARDITPALRAL